MCGQSVEEGGVSAEQLVQGAYPRACGGGQNEGGWDGNAFQKSIARRGVVMRVCASPASRAIIPSFQDASHGLNKYLFQDLRAIRTSRNGRASFRER
jgi:hypothetical protein